MAIRCPRHFDRRPAETLASGGVLTELVADAVTILLPASRVELVEALGRLRISRLLDGFRGAAPANRAMIVDALLRLASHLCREDNDIVEVEVNPPRTSETVP